MPANSSFHREPPRVARRGVHLDLKGLPPTPQRLLKLLDVFAAARFNVVLVEWEDAFPWETDERLRSPTAYTRGEVESFHRRAAELGLEVIPLVQCLGHMETPLRLPEYAPLREVQDRCDTLNPLAAGARELVQRMVEDVLRRSGPISHFHLGGDEAWTFGSNPQTSAFVATHGRSALYLQHVGPLLDALLARGVRPILWHDMMHDWDTASLRRLGAKADVMVWSYQGHPDDAADKFNMRVVERLRAAGVPVWGAAAFKGADGRGDGDLPDVARRTANAAAWSDVAARHALRGVVATGWSRYQTSRVQCDPIDAALDSLLSVAAALHDGTPADAAAVEAILKSAGEWDRFGACRDAVAGFSSARRKCAYLRDLSRQQAWLEQHDDRRRGSGVLDELRRLTREQLTSADTAGAEVRAALAGLVHDRWLLEFIEERLAPVREEISNLR